MVQLRQILDKLGPDYGFTDHILDYDIGEYDFDTVNKLGDFVYDYTNTENPNIKLRIKDDFPLRIVVFDKRGDTIYGTTWNGDKQVKWKRKGDGPIEDIE